MNAAVWFGASLFFTFGVAPAFFTPEMKQILGEVYNGVVAQMVLERYFILQYWCGGIALAHLLAEWVYLGKPLHRLTVGLLLGLFAASLLGGLWLQPKLKKLHQIKYGRSELSTPAQKAQAGKSFSAWHGTASVINLLALGGLAVYAWRVTSPGQGPRFISANKFRG